MSFDKLIIRLGPDGKLHAKAFMDDHSSAGEWPLLGYRREVLDEDFVLDLDDFLALKPDEEVTIEDLKEDMFQLPSNPTDAQIETAALRLRGSGLLRYNIFMYMGEMGERGLIDDEALQRFGMETHNAIRGRRGELVKSRVVRPRGDKRLNYKNNPCGIWIHTNRGRKLYNKILSEVAMPEFPYAEIMFRDGEVLGVTCPTCGQIVPETDPKKAGDAYALHYRQVHGVPSDS